MRAALLKRTHRPLVVEQIEAPVPAHDELLIRVQFCGVCRTDLHIQAGEVIAPRYPIILGHEVIGVVETSHLPRFKKGDLVGVPWLFSTCGTCAYCKQGDENLCDRAEFTGLHRNGGFAEFMVARADFAIPLPPSFLRADKAPFLCAGLIGYRTYKKAGPIETLGIYGFGVAAHLIAQLAVQEGKRVYAFTRRGDIEAQSFALDCGALWAGDSSLLPPESLDAALIFAPVGSLIPTSLKALKKGGRCVCGGIHMSEIPSFPYADLWGEKSIASVANLTRRDAEEFFQKLPAFPVHPIVTVYPLSEVNRALDDTRAGKCKGAAVIQINP